MKIIDTYEGINALIDKMNGAFDVRMWERYIQGISELLLPKIKDDISSYDFDREVLPVMNLALNSGDKLNIAHDSFLAATDNLAERVSETLGADLQVDIIFYLGLCSGAGWATSIGNRKVVLLGAEKIIELGWCDKDTISSLIYHELGHIWHYTAGGSPQALRTEGMKSVWKLFEEGLAMCCEQLLSGNPRSYHQDGNSWLDWCRENEQGLLREYLRRVNNNENTRDFFGDWNSYRGHSNVGYYLGCELVKHLVKKYPLADIPKIKAYEVYDEFYDFCRMPA